MELLIDAPVRLNLGCGQKVIEGYIGVDLCDGADIQADVKSLPFADGYADEIMAIHVLEHLYRWEAEAALTEWLRVLKSDALLVLELPDIKKVAKHILKNDDVRFGLWGAYGDPGYENPLMVHKWGWSFTELGDVLRKLGFRNITLHSPKFHKVKRDMRIEARK